jgi:hypothetical protein
MTEYRNIVASPLFAIGGSEVSYDRNGNIVGLLIGSKSIKIGSNLVNTYIKYWMPYAGTWATDGTPLATGSVPTGHLYAVGDKLSIPSDGSGTSMSTGTVIPAGIYTITASATPNFSCTRDNSPGVNLAVGTGTFNGTSQTEVFRFIVPGGIMDVDDHLTGSVMGYYGAGSLTSKQIRVIASGTSLANFSISTSGITSGEVGFSMRNIGTLTDQLYRQTYTSGLNDTNFGGGSSLMAIDTSSCFDMKVTLQKSTGTDALALWALKIDLERL